MDPLEEVIERLLRRIAEGVAPPWAYSPYTSIDEVLREVSKGELEPIVSVVDRGDYLDIIVDLPGARVSEAVVRLGEDWVEVEAYLREEVRARLREAGLYWGRVEKYYGRIKLPARIDVTSVERMQRGSMIILRARKLPE